MANGVSINPYFHANFKKVNLILVKMHSKKVLAKKLFCKLKNWVSPENRFFGQKFQMYIFEISIKRQIL
jgi:hypothetical protein